MNNNKKQHSTIIPDDVLYCKKIPAGAKLLYLEIAVICQRDSYCREENSYFAKLYNVRKETISGWVKSLSKMHFIKCEIKEKYFRVIFLKDTEKSYRQKIMKGIAKNLKGDSEKPKDITTLYRGPHFKDEVPLNDFIVETIEYTNEQGQKCIEDSIDYES